MTALRKHEDNIVPFKGKKMVDKFERGYVPSSRLYRYEVRPFLTDAARNVYAELEDRINGFKDKTTDHVSYSQLQGGKLKGAKKASPTTVSKGIKELIDLGVISVVSENSRKGNEYQINEVSLVERFEKCSTTTKSVALQNMDSTTTKSVVIGTTKSVDTIELNHRITIIELLNNTLRFQKPLQFNYSSFQKFQRSNQNSHVQAFLTEQQNLITEEKIKSEKERKEKTRKLSFEQVMELTLSNIQKLCTPNLWEQFVINRSEYKKTSLTKNALKTIYDDFKSWGIEKSDISLKTAIKGNHQGLFEPRTASNTNFGHQTQASTRMSEIQELIAQEEQGNATYGF